LEKAVITVTIWLMREQQIVKNNEKIQVVFYRNPLTTGMPGTVCAAEEEQR